jgi:hypothetical protein
MAPARGQRRRQLTGQNPTERGGDPLETAGEGLTQIAEQVKAIRDLDCVRRTCSRPTRIVRRTIPSNHFDARMVT